jgi:hypothetical protein
VEEAEKKYEQNNGILNWWKAKRKKIITRGLIPSRKLSYIDKNYKTKDENIILNFNRDIPNKFVPILINQI